MGVIVGRPAMLACQPKACRAVPCSAAQCNMRADACTQVLMQRAQTPPHLPAREAAAEPVRLALYDVNVAGAHVRKPLLQLLGPHQAQARRHNHQQRPLVLQRQATAGGGTCAAAGSGVRQASQGPSRGSKEGAVPGSNNTACQARLRVSTLEGRPGACGRMARPTAVQRCAHTPRSKMPARLPGPSSLLPSRPCRVQGPLCTGRRIGTH